uniref:Uncharacterized protein n=1 Tax=Rhizophora mucronata TaxID=61149 RepID=A0A2P2N2G9_RHIMU
MRPIQKFPIIILPFMFMIHIPKGHISKLVPHRNHPQMITRQKPHYQYPPRHNPCNILRFQTHRPQINTTLKLPFLYLNCITQTLTFNHTLNQITRDPITFLLFYNLTNPAYFIFNWDTQMGLLFKGKRFPYVY